MTGPPLAFARFSADGDEKPTYRQFGRHPKGHIISDTKLKKQPYHDRYRCKFVADRFD